MVLSVRNKDGHFITDPHSQKERWKEHFTELLNPPLSDANLDEFDGVPSQPDSQVVVINFTAFLN